MTGKTVCLYHGNCFDGICAAWVVRKRFPNVELIPANYGDDKLMTNITQDCYENANINDSYILVDFSFPRELMILLSNKVKSLIVIDHHKTAEEACQGLDFCHFDMNESGASLAWKFFFPNHSLPVLVEYIKDRDLWLFKEPESEAVNAFIQSHEMDVDAYEELYEMLETNDGFAQAISSGNAIVRYKNSLVERLVQNHILMNIAGYVVPVVNSPVLMSELGNALAKMIDSTTGERVPFGAYYFDRADGIRQWGARSIGDFDVSAVAKLYGGGGHKNAAGWQEAHPQHSFIMTSEGTNDRDSR